MRRLSEDSIRLCFVYLCANNTSVFSRRASAAVFSFVKHLHRIRRAAASNLDEFPHGFSERVRCDGGGSSERIRKRRGLSALLSSITTTHKPMLLHTNFLFTANNDPFPYRFKTLLPQKPSVFKYCLQTILILLRFFFLHGFVAVPR